MKKKWLVGLGGLACMALLCMPVSSATGNIPMVAESVRAAEAAQYDGTMAVPVTDRVETLDSIKKVSVQGTLTDDINTEDVYLLDIKESAVTLQIEGIADSMSCDMKLQTLMGTELKSCRLKGNSPMIDTTTATRRESIDNHYLAKGQYLLRISKAFGEGSLSYKVNAYAIDAAETKTVTTGKKYLSYGRTEQYKKVTVKTSGKLTIKCNKYSALSEAYDTQFVNNQGDDFILCDKNKKELTSVSWGISKSYGVKKGTYYIKMQKCNGGDYRVYSLSFSKGNTAATKKKSAKTITKKYKSYVMESGKSKSQWFKFSVKKAKKMKVWISNQTDGALTVECYGKVRGTLYYSPNETQCVKSSLNGKETKWAKGTYYIKISKRFDNNSGGMVKIKLR